MSTKGVNGLDNSLKKSGPALRKILGEDIIDGANLFKKVVKENREEIKAYLNSITTECYAAGIYERFEDTADVMVGDGGVYNNLRPIASKMMDDNSELVKELKASFSDDMVKGRRREFFKEYLEDAVAVYGIISAHQENINVLKKLNHRYQEYIVFISHVSVLPENAPYSRGLNVMVDELGKTYSTNAINKFIECEEEIICNCKKRVGQIFRKESDDTSAMIFKQLASLFSYECMKEVLTEKDKKEIEAKLLKTELNELRASGMPDVLCQSVEKKAPWLK